jgi:hypothetical protein
MCKDSGEDCAFCENLNSIDCRLMQAKQITENRNMITETKKLYFYYKTLTEPFCEIDIDFTVTITPTKNVGTFKNVFDCDSFTLPTLSVGNYYTDKMGGGKKLEAGTILTNSQKVFVFSTSGSPYYCNSEASFKVIIGVETPGDIVQCGSYTLPELAIGKYYTGPAGTGTELEEESLINESTTNDLFYLKPQAKSYK